MYVSPPSHFSARPIPIRIPSTILFDVIMNPMNIILTLLRFFFVFRLYGLTTLQVFLTFLRRTDDFSNVVSFPRHTSTSSTIQKTTPG